jgi:hypothetical protein
MWPTRRDAQSPLACMGTFHTWPLKTAEPCELAIHQSCSKPCQTNPWECAVLLMYLTEQGGTHEGSRQAHDIQKMYTAWATPDYCEGEHAKQWQRQCITTPYRHETIYRQQRSKPQQSAHRVSALSEVRCYHDKALLCPQATIKSFSLLCSRLQAPEATTAQIWTCYRTSRALPRLTSVQGYLGSCRVKDSDP